MLDSIHISNYRTFSSIEVDLPSRVNLIVGANNSGKSSLLEAIYLLTSKDPGSSLFRVFNERGELIKRAHDRRNTRRSNGVYQVPSIFFGRSNRIGQKIVRTSKLPSYKVVSILLGDARPIQQSAFFDDEDTLNMKVRGDMLAVEKIEDGEAASQIMRIVDDGFVVEPDSFSLSQLDSSENNSRFITTSFVDYNELAILWDTITLTPQEEQVIEALRILEPDVERISFTSRQTSNSGVLVKMRGEAQPVSLGSLGDGMRRALLIAAALVSVENGTFLVDEIDTGLYHGVLADIWSLILETSARRNVKVFATTHSWDCVRAFQAALQRRQEENAGQLIRLEKQKSGLVRPIHYSAEELAIAIRQNIEVR